MAGEAGFDLVAAHKHFSAWCFNRAWELIEKPDRTEAEVRRMEALSHASIFHWISRSDCTDKNLAVGYWQTSRIQAPWYRNARRVRRSSQIWLQQEQVTVHAGAPIY